uniref:Chemerin chemokine-like receptor 1 n=1 Tax=Astyanax mexicanus TaxID=7994 RepID=W5LUD0_ASTMX
MMDSTLVSAMQHPNYENHTNPNMTKPSCTDVKCIFFAVANVIIFILGVIGNGVVIWIAGFRMKKSVVTTWYLSLAVADFIFCCTLPFGIIHKIKNEWIFGLLLCNFRYFIKYFNMFSSIFTLVIISVDRCVVVMFPVWAQNKRTTRKASVIVVLTWIISALFSTPMIIFRDTQDRDTKLCVRNYENNQNRTAIIIWRFVIGFVIPFLIIIVCYVIILRKLKSNERRKPFKIMTVVTAAFLICWLPYHTFALLELKYKKLNHFVNMGKVLGVTLANANSFVNPFLYAFVGKNFKKQCYALLSKIENAIEEEGQYTTMQFVKDGKSFTMTIANTNSFLNPFLYAFMGKDIKNQCHALLSKIQNAIEEDSQPKSQGTSHTTSSVAKHSTAL